MDAPSMHKDALIWSKNGGFLKAALSIRQEMIRK